MHNVFVPVGGTNLGNQYGNYGTLGVAAPSNYPGARVSSAYWTDSSGVFWMFGGAGMGESGASGVLNDLWRYDGTNWTWLGGPKTTDGHGTYGTVNVTAPSNWPGARQLASFAIDSTDRVYLFGGHGYAAAGGAGLMNDLWIYESGAWTWKKGPSTTGNGGTFGVRGTAAVANNPPNRDGAAAWIDDSGRFRIFGGWAMNRNDAWMFNGTNWTWMAGQNTQDQIGIYGTLGVAGPTNRPGSRAFGHAWGGVGNEFFVLFGWGCDSLTCTNPLERNLNDWWRFDGTEFTWLDGSNVHNDAGDGGTLGVTSSSNYPSARQKGTFLRYGTSMWLFGGSGISIDGDPNGPINDLWLYDGADWTWVKGSSASNSVGTFGTLGVPDPANVPSGRSFGAVWRSTSGDIYMFGGGGLTGAGVNAALSDFWRYIP